MKSLQPIARKNNYEPEVVYYEACVEFIFNVIKDAQHIRSVPLFNIWEVCYQNRKTRKQQRKRKTRKYITKKFITIGGN
jgi:hypothetical protein